MDLSSFCAAWNAMLPAVPAALPPLSPADLEASTRETRSYVDVGDGMALIIHRSGEAVRVSTLFVPTIPLPAGGTTLKTKALANYQRAAMVALVGATSSLGREGGIEVLQELRVGDESVQRVEDIVGQVQRGSWLYELKGDPTPDGHLPPFAELRATDTAV